MSVVARVVALIVLAVAAPAAVAHAQYVPPVSAPVCANDELCPDGQTYMCHAGEPFRQCPPSAGTGGDQGSSTSSASQQGGLTGFEKLVVLAIIPVGLVVMPGVTLEALTGSEFGSGAAAEAAWRGERSRRRRYERHGATALEQLRELNGVLAGARDAPRPSEAVGAGYASVEPRPAASASQRCELARVQLATYLGGPIAGFGDADQMRGACPGTGPRSLHTTPPPRRVLLDVPAVRARVSIEASWVPALTMTETSPPPILDLSRATTADLLRAARERARAWVREQAVQRLDEMIDALAEGAGPTARVAQMAQVGRDLGRQHDATVGRFGEVAHCVARLLGAAGTAGDADSCGAWRAVGQGAREYLSFVCQHVAHRSAEECDPAGGGGD